MKKHSIVKAAAASAVVALAAAGCGSSAKTTSAPATTTGAIGATGTTAVTTGSTASTSSTETQGITKTTITIGQLADVSGPVPGVFAGAANGMSAWVAYVNSTGGIAGRKVVLDFKDSGLSCNLYTSQVKDLASSVFALVGTFSLADACGTKTLKADPTLPDIQASVLNPSIAVLPNVYAANPATSGYPTTGFQWVKDKYGAAAVQHTAGLYSQAAAANFAEQETAADAIGYKYLYSREFGDTETNYTSDILRMKSEGVEVVDLLDLTVQDLADFLQQASQQNFHPLAELSTTGYDPSFFKLVGNPAFATSVVFPLPFSMYLGEDAAAVPEITTMTTWLKKTHPSYPPNLFVLDGYAAGLLFQQSMEALGSNPTQSELLAAVAKDTTFTANGLFSPSNVGQKKGQTCDVIVTVANGKYVRTDPSKGFECNGTYVYSKAQA